MNQPRPAGIAHHNPALSFETGPSRPPSEAQSLLIRATRGCSWHKCEFCSSHRTSKLGIRRVADIQADIETVKAIVTRIEQTASRPLYKGDIKQAAADIYSNPPNESFRIVALWLYCGGTNVFLQDADSLIMKTADLVEVIHSLKQAFPEGVFIFLVPPSPQELERRLRGRGTESPDNIQERLARVAYELAAARDYTHLVVNDDLERAVGGVREALA